MNSAAATAVIGLALLTILASSASCVEAKRTQGLEVAPEDACGGAYDGTKGNITSPNYPGNYPGGTCLWTVTTPPNTRITVTIEDFHTYNSYAYLEIRDGNSSSAELIETCYYTSCDDFTSSTNTLYLYFDPYYSYSSYSAKGFKLIWFSDPGCGEDYTGRRGQITSANHPYNYPKNVDCVWSITTLPKTRIKINFESFATYNSSDYLQIRDGPDMNAKLLGRCSGFSCSGLTSSNNSLYIHFHSSSEDQATGFMLNWDSDACGGAYEGTKGTITSLNYPGNYPNGVTSLTCLWTVTAPPNTRITVTIEDFIIYDSSNVKLIIRDGNNSSAELIEQCSSTSCDDFTSSTNTLYLYFDPYYSTVSAKGFKLIWFSDPDCGEDYTWRSGEIASANHPYNYPKDVDCVWTITTRPNTRITINFESFDTYDTFDYLQIRDGPDMNAKLLGRCSGSSCSGSTSSNNSVYIHFHSSSEDQATGFMLNWDSELLEARYCYSCGNNSLDSDHYDPACGEDNYDGHDGKSNKWNACYINVDYSVGHIVRGGTENVEEDGTCYSSGTAVTCYCKDNYCNSDLCQNCPSTPPPLTSTTPLHTTPTSLPFSSTPSPLTSTTPLQTTPTPLPISYTTISPPITLQSSPSTVTSPPATSPPPSATTTTNQSPTPSGLLQCFTCISCDTISDDTHVETSEEFLSCFTAIELGASHFVIRGGSPDLHEDESCRHVDGVVYECYCTSNRCNSDAMDTLLGEIGEIMNTNILM